MPTISTLREQLARLWADKSGATAIEYALIAAGVGAAVSASVYGLGSRIQDTLYNKLINLF
jgi:pilus assembly protein Flp/PilA